MPDLITLPGMATLRARAQGDPAILVAILDGRADRDHDAFAGADITWVDGYWLPADAADDNSTRHATHISSLIFGQPGSTVHGIAPRCRGLGIQSGGRGETITEIGITRAFEIALDAGAQIIHSAFCVSSQSGETDALLKRALARAEDAGVVVVNPAGNNYAQAWCSPANIPSVLAVGALADSGSPAKFTNFGTQYLGHAIMGPGEDVPGAKPGGGIVLEDGTSVAAPVVTGVIAALTSAVYEQTGQIAPQLVREVLLATARPCTGPAADRCIGGVLAIDRAIAVLLDGMTVSEAIEAFPQEHIAAPATPALPVPPGPAHQELPPHSVARHYPGGRPDAKAAYTPAEPGVQPAGVEPALRYPAHTFALGQVSVEFPDERTRLMFAEAMGVPLPSGAIDDVPALIAYLDTAPPQARQLNWVLQIDGAKRYAIRPSGVYADDVYDMLAALALALANGSISLCSIPGVARSTLTTLADGTRVRDLRVAALRGIYGWHPQEVARQSLEAVHGAALAPRLDDPLVAVEQADAGAERGDAAVVGFSESTRLDWPALATPPTPQIERAMRDALDLISFRRPQSPEVSRERAVNFAATNGYQVAAAFLDAMNEGLSFEGYGVEYSPFARVSGNCWDVVLRFIDPDVDERAPREYRLTVDIDDVVPVTVGRMRRWASAPLPPGQ